MELQPNRLPVNGLSHVMGVRDDPLCEENLAHFKVPTHVRIKSNFPMTVTGKPQKFVMRELMERELDEN